MISRSLVAPDARSATHNRGWGHTPLSEVATPISRVVPVEPGKMFRTLGVKWWGEGAYERQTIDGSQTAAKTLSIVKRGDLIINKIWVRHGSVAVVNNDVDGCAGSGEFPTFELDSARILPRWMHWLSKMQPFWSACDRLSRGTSGKNRIRPELFLTISIPLPPLEEQRRIVAKIEQLAAKIDESHRLRLQSAFESDALMARAAADLVGDSELSARPLDELLREPSRNGLSLRPSNDPPGLRILRISAGTSRADGIVEEQDFKYLEVTEQQCDTYLLEPGDLLACRFNGNLHFVGRFTLFLGETDEPRLYPDKLIRFRVDDSVVLPEYVRTVMNSPYGRTRIEEFCQTTAGNIGISAKNLNTIPVPVPPLTEQRRIVTYLDGLQSKVDRLRTLQQQTAAELDALLPSILDKAFKGDL